MVEIINNNQERTTIISYDLNKILKGNWPDVLRTESFEEASASFEKIKALNQWRREAKESSFSPFYQLVEAVTLFNSYQFESQKEKRLFTDDLVDGLTFLGRSLSPGVFDLYLSFLSDFEGVSFKPQFEQTAEKLKDLKAEKIEGRTILDELYHPLIPWAIKQDRIEKRLLGYLQGVRTLDYRENIPPPPQTAEHESSMDEMQKLKEGEIADANCTISPAYGGYWRKQSLDTWDSKTNSWRQSQYNFQPINISTVEQITGQHIVINDVISNKWMRLSLSDDFDLDRLMERKGSLQIQQDQNGDYLFFSKTSEPITFALKKLSEKRQHQGEPKIQLMLCDLTEETKQKIQEIAQRKKGNVARAGALAAYTIRHLHYSTNPSFNQRYKNHLNGKIGGIDRERQADCDVSLDYFAALCSQLKIPVRLVLGHMVKGKDPQGNSRITSDTGHAWGEVWNEENNSWVRIDPTPLGDPLMQEEQQEGREGGIPGDYGGQEAIMPTDEELVKLEEDLANLTEKLSYTEKERQLSEAASIELKEARQIVKEIQKAENTKLPNGERVVDVLSQLFNLIIEARKTKSPDFTGPLRKREGGEEIENIVAHYIGIKSGESDPASRQKIADKTHEEQVFGGFDVYLIGDKSGSMSETYDGQVKWELQRLAQYLIFSSLHRFEQNLQRNKVYMNNSLSVRTQGISFRGSDINDIDIDKPLSNRFTPTDKVALWHSLGNQGSGNGDVAALSHIYNQIKTEIGIKDTDDEKTSREKIKKDNRLRIIIACSDGAPDSKEGVHQLAEALGKLNTVVVGIGLTESAANVPIIFNGFLCKPKLSNMRGDIAKDINDLSIIVVKHIISLAIKLFPEKSQKQAKQIIDKIIAKFKK